MFYSNDHPLPYVHVRNADGEAKFTIDPVACMENRGLKQKDILLAESINEENKMNFLSRLEGFFNNNSPGNARNLEVPVNARLRNFMKTTDAGYLFALEDMAGMELTLVKSDSSCIILPCNTTLVPVQYEKVNGTKHKNANINSSAKNTILLPGNASLEVITLTLIVKCKSNYCSPHPEDDTCSAGFMKIMQNSFPGSGVYSGFIMNDTLFTRGTLMEKYSAGEQIAMGAIGKYDLNGNFIKGRLVYTDELSTQPPLWPGGNDTLIMKPQFNYIPI